MKNGKELKKVLKETSRKNSKPFYSIKDYAAMVEDFDPATKARIESTIAVLNAIDKQIKHLQNGKN